MRTILPDILDTNLAPIYRKLQNGQRLSLEDGITLFESDNVLGVGFLANLVRERLHGKTAFYVYNQHINYTNICKNQCKFCAFGRQEGCEGAYVLSLDEIEEKMLQRIEEPITEIHVVGGVHPDLPWSYYLNLVKRIKKIRPESTVKAFTAVEIDYLSRISGLGLAGTIKKLKHAGLEAMPGGGAEVFSSRIQEQLFPRKISGERWLEVMGAAHEAGIKTNATILYGHMETVEERVNHLIKLRELQDRVRGFMAFIPLAFHSANTALHYLPSTSGCDDLKMIAVSRLMLDNFPHIKAYWVMVGLKMAQVALSFGADDLDGTIMGEQISHNAGAPTPHSLTRDQLRSLITTAGFEPFERDAFYREAA